MVACSPFGPAGELAASRHGVITRSQAAAHGISRDVVRRMLRDRLLTEPTPGVLVVTGSPPTWHQQLTVATLAGSGAGVVGFRAAAALHGMDGFAPGPVEIVVTTSRHIRLPDLVMHRGPLPSIDVLPVEGLRCTSIARTLCDLGTVTGIDTVRVAFEWAWRGGYSLEWFRQTADHLDPTATRRGANVLRRIVADAERRGVPTESPLEARCEAVLDALPGVVRQHPVLRDDGSFVARVDFAIPELKIAIEAHSRKHHFGPAAEESDAAREAELHAEGWIVRFVTDRQRRDPVVLRSTLERLVAARRRAFGST